MRIRNIREGFAANSSSSHSTLFVSSGLADWDDYYSLGENFGWNDFVLKSRGTKGLYLLAQLSQSMMFFDGTQVVTKDAEAKDLLRQVDAELMDIVEGEIQKYIPAIDHESQWSFPRNSQGEIDVYAVKLIKNILMDPKVGVFGGNDNDDYGPELPLDGVGIRLLDWLTSSGWTTHHIGRYMVLFNYSSGNRIIVDKDEDRDLSPEEDVTTDNPLLVDLKITDRCKFNCSFCYQGSTVFGEHASLESIKSILSELASIGVLEIALGGGEPTSHPDFEEILRFGKSLGLRMNYTTNDLKKFVADYQERREDRACVGVALSLDEQRIKVLVEKPEIIKKAHSRCGELTFHIIPSLLSAEAFADLRELAGDRLWGTSICLLGFKYTGRGASLDQSLFKSDSEAIVKFIEERLAPDEDHYKSKISVDTVLLNQLKDDGKTFHSLEVMYKEGKTSMYIDAVENTCAKSSYNKEVEFPVADGILAAWNCIKRSDT